MRWLRNLRHARPDLRWFAYAGLALGLYARLYQYVGRRSLWYDEAHVALRIIGPRFWDILFNGLYVQTMPVGLAILQRLVVDVLGPGELALRLIPFVAGVATVVLMIPAARRALPPASAVIAIFLFAIHGGAVFYSTEAKQYSTDIFCSSLLLLVALDARVGKFSLRHAGFLAIAGMVLVWISHPAIFVLMALAVALSIECIELRNWSRMNRYGWAFAAWSISFAIVSVLFLRQISRAPGLIREWTTYNSFAPVESGPVPVLGWVAGRFADFFRTTLGTDVPWLAGSIFLAGCFPMARRHRSLFIVATLPIVLAAVAAAFKRYPFEDRMLMFLVPGVVLIVADGLGRIRERAGRIAGIAAAVAVLYAPLTHLSVTVRWVEGKEEIRPVLEYIQERSGPDDWLYVYSGALPAFEYYRKIWWFDYEPNRIIKGTRVRNRHGKVYRQVDEIIEDKSIRRVWFLFSHLYPPEDARAIERRVDAAGTRLESFYHWGAYTHLYDVKQPPPEPGK